MTSTLKRKIDTLEHPASVPPEKRQRVLEFLDVHPGTPDGPNEQVLRMFMHSVLIAIAESYSAPDLANGHFTSDFCQKHDSLNGLLRNVFMAREERDAHFGILWSRVIHILEGEYNQFHQYFSSDFLLEEKKLPVPFSTQREMETSNLEIMNRHEMSESMKSYETERPNRLTALQRNVRCIPILMTGLDNSKMYFRDYPGLDYPISDQRSENVRPKYKQSILRCTSPEFESLKRLRQLCCNCTNARRG